ncbi:hypothetical protein SLS62_003714 [Diatrype stigma]|uniref:Mannan endo-1,6-alpha-mannosidase n=1 Tax=Diatrype stigma TaxID=117547 RepID=A0AAN9UY61_9PEZI
MALHYLLHLFFIGTATSTCSSAPAAAAPLALAPAAEAPTPLAAAKEAVDALMAFYDPTSGLWGPGNAPWWQSALALQAVVDYMALSGSREYVSQARHTIEAQRGVLPWWPAGGGEFRAESTDDTGWWALALVAMHELTGEAEFLDIAKADEAYMWEYWTGSDGSGNSNTEGSSYSCGGGIIWQVSTRSYHNAISNELYLLLAAKLHNLNLNVGDGGVTAAAEPYLLDRALREWDWFRNSGMINGANLINDGLLEDAATQTCANNNAPTWTYNQGVVLTGLAELYRTTGDGTYLDAARRVADAVLASPALLGAGGILTEPCTASGEDCDPDRTAFKGIFMRQLAKLDAVLVDRPYAAVIQRHAQAVYAAARNASGFYGGVWQGPFDKASVGRQASAVLLLLAALEP